MSKEIKNRVNEQFFTAYGNVLEYGEAYLGKMPTTVDVTRPVAVQTGILSLDIALGGGLMSGSVEIFGEESSGKTALAACILKKAQEIGLMTLLCAGESPDLDYFSGIGVDLSKLALTRDFLIPSLEAASDFLYEPRRVVVIDSVTSLRFESDDTSDRRIFTIKGFLEEMHSTIPQGSVLVAVSQVRAARSKEPGRLFRGGTESADRWLVDLYDTRLEVSRSHVSEDSYIMRTKIIRAPFAKPGTVVEIPVDKGAGPNIDLDRLQVAVQSGLVERRGPSYFFGPVSLGVGATSAARALRNDTSIREAVMDKLLPR